MVVLHNSLSAVGGAAELHAVAAHGGQRDGSRCHSHVRDLMVGPEVGTGISSSLPPDLLHICTER